ncbi:hypothetical protein [Streptomyces sp. 11x1]|uniref:hypothetical protein n=1 Tax=Streptomyces sp. 11x1 TaxID=3038642 RepID=UPI0029306584|nr:hypothetical protein [Streptomyces sp. 11x1]WNZ06546.1 hypothetical protein P8T65_02375 [Streptomyces sp. 11x1]
MDVGLLRHDVTTNNPVLPSGSLSQPVLTTGDSHQGHGHGHGRPRLLAVLVDPFCRTGNSGCRSAKH